MNEKELEAKIAHLESINDQLYAELSHVDELMRLVGFVNGLETVKETARNIFEQDDEYSEYDDESAAWE